MTDMLNQQAMDIISTDSMRGFLIYMQGRFPYADMVFRVSQSRTLVMYRQTDYGYVAIEFMDEDHVKFTFKPLDQSYTVERVINRSSTFNGCMIEFITKPEEHFREIYDGYKKAPIFYKEYKVS